MRRKIYSIDALSNVAQSYKCCGQNVVMCHGVFDVLHIGHLKHLEAAKALGDVLVVTITSDRFVNKGPDRPIFSSEHRAELIASIGCVDYVAINDDEFAINAILSIKPNLYVKGTEYNGLVDDAISDEENAVNSVGGKLVFTDDITYSSSNIINNITLPNNIKDYLKTFKYTYNDIIEWLNKLKDLRVLVISETIVDEYQYGESLGKSGKAPIVAFKVGKNEKYSGGASIICLHLSTFVNTVTVVRSNVIIKKRYIENTGNQKLFETYDMDENQPDICEEVASCIDDYDMVLVADFGHGLLTNKLRDIIKKRTKFLAVATQRNAGNMGHNTIRKYWDRKENIYICVDEDELRLAVHEKYSRHHDLFDIIKNELAPTTIITRGPNGCVFSGGSVPAFATTLIDAVGAGDAFFSITAPLMCIGAPMDLVGFLGCVAGAIKVSYSGNKEHITKNSLCRYAKTLLK